MKTLVKLFLFCTSLIVLLSCSEKEKKITAQSVILDVNEALKNNDIAKAESYCAAYMEQHFKEDNSDKYNDMEAIRPAIDAIIGDQTSFVLNLVKSDEIDDANTFLSNLTISPVVSASGTALVVEKYDAMYYSVINAYLKKGDIDSAGSLALVYKSKINNDMSWKDSSCYKLLKMKYKELEKDFSILKSTSDCE